MKCLACEFKNPGTLAFCQKCGAPLDFSADEISDAMVAGEKEKRRTGTEHHSKNFLIAGVVLFLLSVTAWFLAGGAPQDVYLTPPASEQARFMTVSRHVEQVWGVRDVENLIPVVDCALSAPR